MEEIREDKYQPTIVAWTDGEISVIPHPLKRKKPLHSSDSYSHMQRMVEKYGHLVKTKRKGEKAQSKEGRARLQAAFDGLSVTEQDIQDALTYARFVAGDVEDAYYAFLNKPVYGRVRQYHYKPGEFNEQNMCGGDTTPELAGRLNVYMSINAFYRPQRRSSNTRYLTAVGIDLDYRKVDKYAHLSHHEMLQVLEQEVFGNGVLPSPSVIIHAGNMQLIYPLSPAPYDKARKVWKAVVRYFTKILEPYGADTKCTDFARVLRLPGTYHPSGVRVWAEYQSQKRWELRDLQRRFLPELPIDWKEKQKERRKKKRAQATAIARATATENNVQYRFTIKSLFYQRSFDLIRLAELRGWDPQGHREEMLFLYRYFRLRFHGNPDRALAETEELNGRFIVPYGDDAGDSIDETQSAETMWMKEQNPEARKKAREQGYPDAGYNYTNESLIERLKIIPEEERHLSTIISEVEKARRKRERAEIRKERLRKRRREEGRLTREEYEAPARVRQARALELFRQGLSKRRIGKLLGCSEAEIRRLLYGIELEEISAQGATSLYLGGALALGAASSVSPFDRAGSSASSHPSLAAVSEHSPGYDQLRLGECVDLKFAHADKVAVSASG